MIRERHEKFIAGLRTESEREGEEGGSYSYKMKFTRTPSRFEAEFNRKFNEVFGVTTTV